MSERPSIADRESIKASRHTIRANRVAMTVGVLGLLIAAVVGIAGVVISLAEDDDPPAVSVPTRSEGAASTTSPDGSHTVAVEADDVSAGDADSPGSTFEFTEDFRRGIYTMDEVATLPAPPPPTPDDECTGWQDYFESIEAVQAPDGFAVDMYGATADTRTTLTAARITVYRRTPLPEVAALACDTSGDGIPSAYGEVDLSADHPVLNMDSPSGQVAIGPGGTYEATPEDGGHIVVSVFGTPGTLYEYSVELDAVIGGQKFTRTLGSREEPVLAFMPDPPPDMWRYDMVASEWAVVVPAVGG